MSEASPGRYSFTDLQKEEIKIPVPPPVSREDEKKKKDSQKKIRSPIVAVKKEDSARSTRPLGKR